MTAPESSPDYLSNSLLQNSFYIGINLENILYGIELVLYFKTMWELLTRGRAGSKSNIFFAVFSSMMLFLVTIWVAGSAFFGQKMWILDAPFPGGPDQYWKINFSVWYVDAGTTSAILLQLMTDGLMIYRCRIICNSYRAIAIPIILWLGNLVLGIIVDWASSSPGGNFFSGFAAHVGFAYYTTAVVLNTTLTCMICYSIMRHGKTVQEQLSREYASPYFSIVALIIESVLPYTLSGIAFLVSLGAGSDSSTAFVSVYMLMMCISPQMLILRVIMRRTWVDSEMFRQSVSINFSPETTGTTSHPQPFDNHNPGAKFHLQTLPNVHLVASKV